MPLSNPVPPILKTKQHFAILDGLRGVAAVAVVIFHFMEFVTPDYHDNFIAHSYLAVDFFFCLSGFVIAYAYDNKVESIGTMRFLKLRLIRLHPLVLIGSILGLLCFVFDPFSNLQTIYGNGKTFLLFLSSCFLIPYPIVTERYFNLFHLNPPTWSLFWEYIANVFYVLILFKLRNKMLWALTLIAALVLGYECFKNGYVGIGWGGDTFLGGGARVFYSFLAGMLVYRLKWIIKSRLGFISLSLLLLAAFLVPFSYRFNPIVDLAIVILYFPLLVALGAGANYQVSRFNICKFSGEISYPLYMVHYPFLWVFLSYLEINKPPISHMVMMIPIGLVLLIAIAYLIMVYLDIPIRKYLMSKMKKKLA